MRGAITARTKADGSPVTDADIAAEQAIRAVAAARFPGDGFYGEESAAERMDAEHLWIVDPIDGTKSFVRRYPMFSTQIAVMRRGQLRARRFLRRRPTARRPGPSGARGAFLDGAPLAVSRIARLEEATLSTGNLRSLAPGPRWAAFGRLVARLDRIRGFGDFLHYHLLAAGKIDAVLESRHPDPRHRGAHGDRRGSWRARHRPRGRPDRPGDAQHPCHERRAARDAPWRSGHLALRH